MTASGLPAALIKLAISAGVAGVSCEFLLETLDTPESIDPVRGGPLGAEELELPAIAGSFGLRIGSDALRVSFGL